MIRQLFKNSGIYFVGSLISKAVMTIAWIALARVLPPEKYGEFTLYFLILQMATFIGDFGLNQWYLKKADGKSNSAVFNKIVQLRSLTLLATIIILGIVIILLQTHDTAITAILLISLIPMAMLSVADPYYLEKKQSFRASLKLTSVGTLFLLGYLFFGLEIDLLKTVIILLFSLTVTTAWYFPWKEISALSLTSLESGVTTLKESSSYLYLTLTSYFYNRGDSFLISYFKGNAALGIYGLAYRFLESLALFSSSITQNLFPISAKKDGITLKQLFKIVFLMFLSGIMVGGAVYVLADLLIIGLFGIQYSEAVPILKIFSLILVLFFLNAPFATVVQSSHLVNKFLPYGISNTLLNIILNIIFIPGYGIFAAAWVMVVTELTGLIINLFFVKKLYKD